MSLISFIDFALPRFSRKPWKPACLAPWVHSFVYTTGARRLCCISENLSTDGEPIQAHWNGKLMRKIRRQMLKGVFPQECARCDPQTKTTPEPLYEFFNSKFGHLKSDLKKATSRQGHLKALPVSFDHRTSNQCNFKCRMCSSAYSSSWEQELRSLKGEGGLPAWQREPQKSRVEEFQRNFARAEITRSIEDRTIKDLYWAGGEPLLNDFHWASMKRIIELRLPAQVQVRYSTNLSTLTYRGTHLFKDILRHFPEYSISASLDATGALGEYLRTGLQWKKWEANFEEASRHVGQNKWRLSISHALTTVGLFDLPNLLKFSEANSRPIFSQALFVKQPREFMSPLSPLVFPRPLLVRLVEECLCEIKHQRSELNASVFSNLESLLGQTPWIEKFPEHYEQAARKGMRYFQKLESVRPQSTLRFLDLMKNKPYMYDWLVKYADSPK